MSTSISEHARQEEDSIQRYQPSAALGSGGDCWVENEPDAQGEFVRYEDHLKAIDSATTTKEREMRLPRNAILVGMESQSILDMELDGLIGGEGCEKLDFDTYDGSIEICIAADAKVDSEALLAFLKERGFTYGWLNFSDGTEQHFNKVLYERRKVNSPRWTEEKKRVEYYGGEPREVTILREERDALQARVLELQKSLAWTLDHLDEDVEEIHHRKVTDCRQALQP